MCIPNFKSSNIDRAYQVGYFVQEGEITLAGEYISSIGGRGLNQPIALARTGAHAIHAGAIGSGGMKLEMALEVGGVDTDYIMRVPEASGHTAIQITNGENSIIVHGGANRTIGHVCAYKVLDESGPDDLLLAQNEISYVPYTMKQVKTRRTKVVINTFPITAELLEYPPGLADYIIANE